MEHLRNAAVSQTMPWNSDWQAVCVCLLEGKAEAGLQHSWCYTRDEAFKVRSEKCEPPMCTYWLGAEYDRLPPSSQASSAWTSASPPPPWQSPPPLPPEEVLKGILDELTGVQGRVHKIEMMIIKLLNRRMSPRRQSSIARHRQPKETVFEHR